MIHNHYKTLIFKVIILIGSLFGLAGHCLADALTNPLTSKKLDVVYIPQNDTKSCATTSMAMVISYYEHLNDQPLDKECVWKLSKSDEKTVHENGNDMEGLKRIADFYGYESEYIDRMKMSDVEELVSEGIPVMLNIQATKNGSATHALLVIGYDKNKEIFYINDPANPHHHVLTYADLTVRWSAHLSSPLGKSHQSGFIIYPKNRK